MVAHLGLLGAGVIVVREALLDHDHVPRELLYSCVINLSFSFPVRLAVLYGFAWLSCMPKSLGNQGLMRTDLALLGESVVVVREALFNHNLVPRVRS